MSLSYMKETVHVTKEKKVLSIPETWGMFTAAGNRRLKAYAEKLVQDIEAGVDKLKVFKDYFLKYRRLQNSLSKNMLEAGDTDVREQVWGFGVMVGKCVGYTYGELDDLWEDVSSQAYRERKAKS